jgi:integrase/recombinase XerD
LRQQIDVHGTKRRYELALARVRKDPLISDHNRKLILKFTWDLQGEGIKLARLLKYLNLLPAIARYLKKDFEKTTEKDLRKFLAEINGSEYAEWTKSDYRVTLKRFFRWLRHLPRRQDPPETAWITVGTGNKRILPEELLNEDDIAKMLLACESSRDRAFLLCTDETGGRIAELLNLQRKHVTFDEYGAILIVSGKTGDRRIRVVASAPALAQWLNDNPLKEPDAPLWIVTGDAEHSEPLLYDGARFLLRRLANKAGVKKKVNPNAFRYSRASRLANVLTERQMEQYLGWTTGSEMPRVYVHLAGRDTDAPILRMNGVEVEQRTTGKPKLAASTCPRCKQKNTALDRFCASCGLI